MDEPEDILFSTPRKRARLNRSGSDELSFNLSPIRSQLDDTIICIDTDDDAGEQNDTYFPSFNTTGPETCESFEDTSTNQLPSSRDNQNRDEELAAIGPLLISYCCTRECLLKLCALDVLKTRKHFSALSAAEKRSWLMDRLRNDSQITGTGVITKFIVAGKEVCKAAWCKILPVSEKTVSSLLNQVGRGQVCVPEHGNSGRKRVHRATEDARSWMERYFQTVGDHMPHNDRIHLPSWDSQKFVFERYQEDIISQGGEESDVVALRTFYRIWREDFSHVVIPEEDRFAKCDLCVKVKMDRRGEVNKEVQAELKMKLKEHLARVQREREKYHNHRTKSRSFPDKSMTVIIDGMDQAKTNIPNTRVIAKSTSGLWRLRTHVTGCLLHTQCPQGKLAYAFLDLLQWPHDSNLTVTTIMNILVEADKIRTLPETLNLQLDNTARENKNKYVLGFCALLIEKKIFKKVKINFLPVGHTHEDVDQLFSKISSEIKGTGSESLPDLLKTIASSSTPTPSATMLQGVWDFKTFITPHLCGMKYHSKPLCFRFTPTASGKAQLHHKRFSDSEWIPNGEGLQILATCPPDDASPSLVKPCLDKLDLEHLLRDLPKYKQWLKAVSWSDWEEFMANTSELSKSADLQWKLRRLIESAKEGEEARKAHPPPRVDPQTMDMLNKELSATHEIVISKPSGSGAKRASVSHDQPSTSASTSHNDQPSTATSKPSGSSTTCGESTNYPIGSFVAVYKAEYQDEIPTIGKVMREISETSVEVEWWYGRYSTVWHMCKRREGKKYVPWTEVISKDDILMPVTFTKSNHINKQTVIDLKQVYAPYIANGV